MNINKTIANSSQYEMEGELIGAFIGTNQFSYQLAPYHPKYGIIFSVYCDVIVKGNISGEIKFKGQVTFFFDSENHKPSLEELLELTRLGTIELNKILEKEILEKSEIVPFKIYDSDPENTLNTLKQNLIIAYPEN